MTHVAVGLAARHARQHPPGRRGAVEHLDLGLLVYSGDDGRLGRVEIEAGHIARFDDELRVA